MRRTAASGVEPYEAGPPAHAESGRPDRTGGIVKSEMWAALLLALIIAGFVASQQSGGSSPAPPPAAPTVVVSR